MAELQNPLPPGWDSKRDPISGKYYYINHYTKTTTWEDPRIRHRHLHTTTKQAYAAAEYIQLQDMKPKASPLTVRSAKVQDSTFMPADPDEVLVGKISGMFPTVSETHIKMLIKNCRYMKSIFPRADEMIILDVLQGNENNIQKTSEVLKDMGFERKDTVKVAQQKLDAKREQERREEEQEVTVAVVQPRVKTSEEKQRVKVSLQEKYKDVAEHLICIALESVNFDEERANQILQIMIQEDSKSSNADKKGEDTVDLLSQPSTSSATLNIPVSQSRQSLKSLLKSEKELDKSSYSRVVEEDEATYKSTNLCNTRGPNPEYVKGANEQLLLEDYVKWQGPNSTYNKGSQKLAQGPNSSLLTERSYKACGPNRNLIKGPQCGLAKGSIFSQFQTAVVVGESRGE
ncbi:uncharacterized protein LOC114344088 isoform X5 [Diabrotica virgifera virgifera]|uniref:Uncharacterized protein LOC114344088 isoform X5 n=1 Tax=Diabrotica virgifera virgifera TaxID=50390 RepID=A0A6P7GZ80_DIAVI|nr:uncharacterized protein LOC114344088 isoform X5 [Diabrotica virgifera virgifera]